MMDRGFSRVKRAKLWRRLYFSFCCLSSLATSCSRWIPSQPFLVTTDPFLVYTSNVFAILGLRSMYFLLAGIVHRFVYLKYGLAFILAFVGVKMVVVDFYHVPIF